MSHQAIPLSAPDGTIYAYACGHCRKVASGGERLCNYDDELVAEFARDSWRAAVDCCRCRECGGVNDRDDQLGDAIHCSKCKPTLDSKWAEWRAAREAKQRAREDAEAEALKLAKSASAALSLRTLMQNISEDYYCAGWLTDLEFSCWSFAHGGPCRFGLGEVTQAECDQLRELGEAAGGWWTWRDDAGGEVFVTTEEWLPIWDQHEAELKAWEESRK